MVKRNWIKEILESLIKNGEQIGRYSKREVERAIIECRGADPRTINNWFGALLKLDYLLQPELGVYTLNLDRIASLEVKLPTELDPKQARLYPRPSTHAHSLSQTSGGA